MARVATALLRAAAVCPGIARATSVFHSRGLFTSLAARAGVDPKDEAIYSDEHWEMRQVCVCEGCE